MAEVQSRGGGTRGRGGLRGGRGGYRGATRNPSRTQSKPDNEQENIPPVPLEDQGEVGELLKKYGNNVKLLKEICPGWSDQDLAYALNETDGDVENAFDRISTGSISQWGEVKKKQPKSKDAATASTETSTRGRGRGGFEGRGRGRGAERGARGGRGAKTATSSHTNGTKSTGDGWDTTTATQATPEATGGWDTAPTNGDATAPASDEWANEPGKDALSSLQTEEPKPASNAAPSTAKPGGWAGLFAKPTPAPAPKKATTAAHPEEQHAQSEPEPANEEPVASIEPVEPPPIEPVEVQDDGPSELPSAPHSETGRELTPSNDELTEHNLEQLPDTSHPLESATQASTIASTMDPMAVGDSKASTRPPMSGYHATALKATGGNASRSASFVRKVMEQQEAVVMPGNHAIEKAAVQFGKMGLGADDVDVDEDREEPETRTQLPDDSPAAPRASLPPALPEGHQTPATAPSQPMAEAPQSAQRQTSGLPAAPQQAHEPSPQSASAYADQYRYGQGQKPYDPFGQPQPQTTQAQEPFSNQVPSQPSTATTQPDYSAYYGRDAYNYYGYGHGQEAQRIGSAFGTSGSESQAQYATSRPQQHGLGQVQQDAPGSGNNTPAPGLPAQASQQHSSQLQQAQGHGYPGYAYPNAYSQQYPQYGTNYMANPNHRYGANRPMFDDVRRQGQDSDYYGGQQQQQQQQQYNYGQNHYGSTYKSNMYGQPQQGYSYEQNASQVNMNTFGRESGYGRAGSAQPSEAQQGAADSTGFGGMPDPFGRSSSGFGQTPGLGQQHGGHGEDPSKASGPSPSMQGGRPGSAVNSGFPTQQGGLPPPSQHAAQQAFGGYAQYGQGVGSGHQNTHQQSTGYGSYGSNTGFGGYGGYGGARGGWNGNYASGH